MEARLREHPVTPRHPELVEEPVLSLPKEYPREAREPPAGGSSWRTPSRYEGSGMRTVAANVRARLSADAQRRVAGGSFAGAQDDGLMLLEIVPVGMRSMR